MKKRRIFTLLELLIVIGIIAILAGLLLPALSQARKKAKAINCTSNLKQNILAMTMYTNNYDETIPYLSLDLPIWSSWVNMLLDSGELTTTGSLTCPSTPSEKITVTPGFAIDHNAYGVWARGNYFGTQGINVNGSFFGVSLKTIKNPSNFIIMADSFINLHRGKKCNRQYAYITYKEGYDASGVVADHYGVHAKHNGRINIAYADGHVSPNLPTEYKATFNAMEASGGVTTLTDKVYYYDGEDTNWKFVE